MAKNASLSFGENKILAIKLIDYQWVVGGRLFKMLLNSGKISAFDGVINGLIKCGYYAKLA
ncbi:MAG: hypothetical protein Q8S46_05180 [Methylotenera sp.]|nr:hypothetical protein [Methylotenera sp.]MDO9233293.1 hypothetical protein [Methylotenera sp.]MDO9388350.1 hypothetical protein [Methylotenera sp.]MDP1596017.1 hypothetical protein [Methylotenera sp.]MDP1754938.1 hypothetical protein [Methylotenera sp.]